MMGKMVARSKTRTQPEIEHAKGVRFRMHELGHRFPTRRGNVTWLADRMDCAKPIRREKRPGERPGAYETLTRSGPETRRRVWPVDQAHIAALFGRHITAREARVPADVRGRRVNSIAKERVSTLSFAARA